MRRKSILLILASLVTATLGGYAVARLLSPDLFDPSPTFSTTYYKAGIPIPYPTSEVTRNANVSGRIRSFAVSPDLKTIAMATSKGIILYDLQTYEQLRILSSKENSFSVAFSPDGKQLAAGNLVMQNRQAGDPHLVVWDTSIWEVTFEPKIGNGDATMFFGALAWSPNGNFLATSDYDRGLVTFDIETGDVISLQKDFLMSPNDISWSPNGSRLVATGDLGYGFRRWRIDTDQSVRLYDPRAAAFATKLEWSPDGKRIASAHADGTLCFWTVATNRCDGFTKAHFLQTFSLTWSPDGSQLATGGGIIRIWNTSTGNLVTSFGLKDGSVYSQLKWLTDGRLVSLETGYAEHELTAIRLWDIRTGKILTVFQGESGIFGE